jgi:hypothetical protein
VLTDLAGDGDHYKARIVSPAFRGLNRVKQHQMVNRALADVLGGRCTPWRSKPPPRRSRGHALPPLRRAGVAVSAITLSLRTSRACAAPTGAS